MPDPVEPAIPAAPVAAPETVPAAPATVPAVAEATPAPTPVPAPAEAAVPAVPAVEGAPPAAGPAELPAQPAAPTPATTPTLLEAAGKKPDEAKGKEVSVAEPVAPGQEQPAWKFELPPTLQDSPKEMGEFTGILATIGQKSAQDVGQELINLHANAMTKYAEAVAQKQIDVFLETRQKWATEVMADRELGGAGHRTTMGAIARVRDALVPEKDRPAFDEFLRVTGAGDHPAFLRMLHRAAQFFDEPALPPPNFKPPKDIGKNPNQRNGLYRNKSATA